MDKNNYSSRTEDAVITSSIDTLAYRLKNKNPTQLVRFNGIVIKIVYAPKLICITRKIMIIRTYIM